MLRHLPPNPVLPTGVAAPRLHPLHALRSFALALGLAPVALAAQSGGIDIAFQVGTGFSGQPWCVEIDAQGWYRDPLASDHANLSDGLKFTLCN